MPLLVNRADDKFFVYLSHHYFERSGAYLDGRRTDECVGTTDVYRVLVSLPEHDAFGMFMGLHIYLFLHAQLTADLVVNTTKMARDHVYRQEVEADLVKRTDLPLSFSDSRDEPPASDIDIEAINWAEIAVLGRAAALALDGIGEREQLIRAAEEMIESAEVEAKRCKLRRS